MGKGAMSSFWRQKLSEHSLVPSADNCGLQREGRINAVPLLLSYEVPKNNSLQ